MGKHTPGPWEAVNMGVYAESGREIVFGPHQARGGSEEERRANSFLIAAAPKLLEAAREARWALRVLAEARQGKASFVAADTMGNRALRLLRAAIEEVDHGD